MSSQSTHSSPLSPAPPEPYVYKFNADDWKRSSFPRDLIPYDVQSCSALHVLPPVVPSFYDRIKLAERSSASNTSGTASHSDARRTGLNHPAPDPSLPSGSSLGSSSRRAPTDTTYQLFEKLGTVRFISSTISLRDLVDNALRPVWRCVSAMSPEEAKVLLDEWHVRLRDQEGALWEMADQLVRFPNPPPYPVRVSRDPLPPQYHPVTLVGQLPTNEIGITTNLLIPPFTRLVRRFFKISGFPVDSCEVGAAPDIGSGTSDIALLGAALSSDAWRDYLKFLVEVKLLSPDDWLSLMSSLRDEPEGFRLSYTANERFSTDSEIAAVWKPVLAQITEQFHANRAKHIVITDYDRFVLLTLVDARKITVSPVFFRDRSYPPPNRFQDPDPDVSVMEVIMSLVVLAKPADNPAKLWVEMDAIRDAARLKKTQKRDGDANVPLSTKRLKSTVSNSAVSNDSTATSIVTSIAIGIDRDLQQSGYQPRYTQRSIPTGVTRAILEVPRSDVELVETVMQFSADCVWPDSSLESDKMLSLSYSSQSDEDNDSASSHEAPVEILLRTYLGHGHTFDTYAVSLAVRLPDGEALHVPAVVKQVDVRSLEFFAESQAGYPTRIAVEDAVDEEASILQHLANTCPHVAPRLLALWTSVAYRHVLMAIEDCGDYIARDMRVLDDHTKQAIINLYDKLHAAGILHNDVHPRHVLRDSKDRLRIIDFEGALRVDISTPAGAVAAKEEMALVHKMLGIKGLTPLLLNQPETPNLLYHSTLSPPLLNEPQPFVS